MQQREAAEKGLTAMPNDVASFTQVTGAIEEVNRFKQTVSKDQPYGKLSKAHETARSVSTPAPDEPQLT